MNENEILDLDDEEVGAVDADALLTDLLSEFGDASKLKSKSALPKRISTLPPPPPKPQWYAVARTLRVTRQLCSCGCEHNQNLGVFLEEKSLTSSAVRFTAYNPRSATPEQEALPTRTSLEYQQITECFLCFGIENKLRPLGNTTQQHLLPIFEEVMG